MRDLLEDLMHKGDPDSRREAVQEILRLRQCLIDLDRAARLSTTSPLATFVREAVAEALGSPPRR